MMRGTGSRFPYYRMTAQSRSLSLASDHSTAQAWFAFLERKGIPAALTSEHVVGFGELHNVWCGGRERAETPNREQIQQEGRKVLKTCNGFDAWL